jgi:nicotinamide mononucleotide transporter
MNNWLSENYIEIFGAITGIIYVFLEIRQTIWLWPLGFVTSAVYVWIFFTGKLYADMSLQAYYVVISVLGWYWWVRGSRKRNQSENSPFEELVPLRREGQGDVKWAEGKGQEVNEERERGRNGEKENAYLQVTRLKLKTGFILLGVFIILYLVMWLVLSRLTDSPVPGWDAFLTSLSIVATWMLARKIYEHWFLWIVVNIVSIILYFTRGLYPTVVLYFVYAAMSFIGLKAWKKTIISNDESAL